MEAIKRKIDECDDIAQVAALMTNLNISTKGCKDLEQMKDRICDKYKDRHENLDPKKVNSDSSIIKRAYVWSGIKQLSRTPGQLGLLIQSFIWHAGLALIVTEI